MTSLIMKVIFCPIAVAAVSFLFPNHVFYPSFIYPLVVGFVITLAGYAMEVMLLRPGTVLLSTILDIGASALITYYSQSFINGSYVTLFGALLTAAAIGAIEHVQHNYLVSKREFNG